MTKTWRIGGKPVVAPSAAHDKDVIDVAKNTIKVKGSGDTETGHGARMIASSRPPSGIQKGVAVGRSGPSPALPPRSAPSTAPESTLTGRIRPGGRFGGLHSAKRRPIWLRGDVPGPCTGEGASCGDGNDRASGVGRRGPADTAGTARFGLSGDRSADRFVRGADREALGGVLVHCPHLSRRGRDGSAGKRWRLADTASSQHRVGWQGRGCAQNGTLVTGRRA